MFQQLQLKFWKQVSQFSFIPKAGTCAKSLKHKKHNSNTQKVLRLVYGKYNYEMGINMKVKTTLKK